MNLENICFSSKTIEISEHNSYLELTNRLSYYDDENLNHVMLPYEGVEEFAKQAAETLINQPVQAKYKKIKGLDDLGGHEFTVDANGNAVFGTMSIGTHTNAWISDPEEVVTVNGETKVLPCLYATCRIWKRHSNMISAIKRLFESPGGLNSSWEISTSAYEYANGIKKLTKYEFIGNALLGSKVTPAYSGTSKTISVASNEVDGELMIAEALTQDIISQGLDKENQAKEEKNLSELENKENNVQTSESNVENPVVDNTPNAGNDNASTNPETPENNEIEVSQLTEWDLRKKIREACRTKLGTWCYVAFHFPMDKEVLVEKDCRESELDYVRFTYNVENDVVTVGEPENVKLTVSIAEVNTKIAELETTISNKDEAIIQSGEEITRLKAEISELTPFKEKFEKAEQEKVAAELREKKENLIASITKSGLITKEEIESSEELKGYVESLDDKSLKAVLAERYMDSLNKEVEVSQAENKNDSSHLENASVNLNGLNDENADVKFVMNSYLGK